MRKNVVALVAGVAFGFVLGWARLTDYDVIHAMLRLREWDVFLLMGSAMATGTMGLRLLGALRARTLTGGDPVRWLREKPTRTHVVGSIVFGLGWSIAGTCPGPALAQIGRGQLAGAFTAAGIFAGVLLHRARSAAPKRPADAPAPDERSTLAVM